MTQHPGITAIVPTHDRPELMRQAVQSIVDQDYPGTVEIIVIFDATDPVLPDVTLPENRTLRGMENARLRGLAGARNTGILAATHQLIAFLDDDDAWLPTKLSRQVPVFDAPDVIMSGTEMIIDQGDTTRVRRIPMTPITHAAFLRDRMGGSLSPSSFMFRTRDLIDVGMIDEDLPGSYGEDYDLLLRVSERADVPIVEEPLVTVRWQGQSFFFGQWKRYAEGLSYILAKHEGFRSDRRARGRIESQIAFAWASAGHRKAAGAAARRSLTADPTRIKAYLALAISWRLTTPQAITRVAAKFGRGI